MNFAKPKRSEYEQIVKLLNEAEQIYGTIYSAQEFKDHHCASESIEGLIEREERRDYFCAYNEKNEIVGYASFRLKNAQTFWLSMFYIHPKHQKKGLGTLFLKEVENVAKGLKAQVLVLEADKRATWATGFYTKNGYQILSDEDLNEYPFDKILDKKQVEGRYIFGKRLSTALL